MFRLSLLTALLIFIIGDLGLVKRYWSWFKEKFDIETSETLADRAVEESILDL